MIKCYNCLSEITRENKSLEHIIPNSIGGKLKSSTLLCRDCNSTFGETIDTELAKSYNNLVALLGINRDRQKDYTIKNLKASNGELYHLLDGYIPTPSRPKIKREGNKLKITARDRKQLQQILNGQKRKFPELEKVDVDKIKENKDNYLKEKLSLNIFIGGDGVFRAIAKMAINYYLLKHNNPNDISIIIDIVRGIVENDSHIHIFPIVKELEIKTGEVFHLVHIFGCQDRKILYAYVVLFSFSGFIVNLSDNYSGKDINQTYCYDIVQCTALEKPLSIGYLGRSDFKLYKENNLEEFNRGTSTSITFYLSRLSMIIDKRHIENAQNRIVYECLDESLKKYGMPEILTQEVIDEFLSLLSYRIAVFIDHIQNPKPNRK